MADDLIRSFEFEFPDHSKLHMETDGLYLNFSFIKADGVSARSGKEWSKEAILESNEIVELIHAKTEYHQSHSNVMQGMNVVMIDQQPMMFLSTAEFEHKSGDKNSVRFGTAMAAVASVMGMKELDARKKEEKKIHPKEEATPSPKPIPVASPAIVEDKIIFSKALEDGSEMRVTISGTSLQFTVKNRETLVEHSQWPQEAVDVYRTVTKAINAGGKFRQDMSASLGVMSTRTASDGHSMFIYGTVAFVEQKDAKLEDPKGEFKAEAGMPLDGLGFKGVRGEEQTSVRDTGQLLRM